MVMLATTEHPVACWEFEGDILVLHHPTTISAKYQAMGKWHCNTSMYSFQGYRHLDFRAIVVFIQAVHTCTCTVHIIVDL